MLMEAMGIHPTDNPYADAAIGAVADPVNLGVLLGSLYLNRAADRAGPRFKPSTQTVQELFNDLSNIHHERGTPPEERLLAKLRSSPDLDRILNEIPTGSKFIGAGAQAFAVKTPDGTIVRVDPEYGSLFRSILEDAHMNGWDVLDPEAHRAWDAHNAALDPKQERATYGLQELLDMASLPSPLARIEHPNIIPTHRAAAFGGDTRTSLVEHSEPALMLKPGGDWREDIAGLFGPTAPSSQERATQEILDLQRVFEASGLKPRDVWRRNVGYLENGTPVVYDTDAVLPAGPAESWKRVPLSPESRLGPLLDLLGYTKQVRNQALGERRLPIPPRLLAMLGLYNTPAAAMHLAEGGE